ncbi:MAG: DUF2807 domain-containing protein [Bacteroidales bacterium]|nr:DUF2807 domain-containing protein [Bacteroidales bacterium]
MKQIFFTTAIIFLLFTSCTKEFVKHERIRPSGVIVEETFYLSENIHRVGVSGAINLHLFSGDEDHIKIFADDNVLPHIAVRQISRNGLEIFLEGVSFIRSAPQITVYLTLRDLRNLHLSGASSAHINDVFISDNLQINLGGASRFRVSGRIEANRISATLSGASRMDLVGHSETLDLTLSGASQAFGYGMICDNLIANLSGASRAEFTVLETLSARLSGASVLRYNGNPQIIFSDISGASSLQRR